MAISHICIDCGSDLARVRARPEPHYGLPLVTCPDCGRASVRRRHPLSRAWRTALRVDAALTALLLQLGAIGGFGTLTALCAIGVGGVVFGHWNDPDVVPWRWPLVAASFGLLPMATGTWLGSAFAHWRGYGALIGWGLFMFVVISIAVMFVAYDEYLWEGRMARHGGVGWEGGPQTYLLILVMWWGQSMVALATMLAATMVSMPLGRGPRWLALRFRQWRWGWRRRRRREGRIAL